MGYVLGKKASKKIPMKKLQNHIIETKKRFVPRKGKMYLLLKEKREEMYEFIEKQLRKECIELLVFKQIDY